MYIILTQMVLTRKRIGRRRRRVHTRKQHGDNDVMSSHPALQPKCRMKSCRASKYQSVYGSTGGSVRSLIADYIG